MNEGILLYVFLIILVIVMLGFLIKMSELAYIMRNHKPYYIFLPFFLNKITSSQREILENQFQFYKELHLRYQKYFEHRVVSFIKDKRFVGREELEVTEEMKVLISATAVMLTFGFRSYKIGLINQIFIYPGEFYSLANESYHKGEFNPKLKTLVLSWNDFKNGFECDKDNINLGIHEFAHAIHLNSIKSRDVSSTIFSDSFKELTSLLASDENIRESLLASKYFRNYAYTNQFEFLAVIIETFFESPSEFRAQFPEVYYKTKQMLNFNFADY